MNHWLEIEPLHKTSRADFRADILHCLGRNGCSFGFASADDMMVRFGKNTHEFILFSTVVAGAARLDTHRGGEHDIRASQGLAIVDGTEPLTSRTRDHTHLYLTVPAAMAEPILAGRHSPLSDGSMLLPATGLTRFLVSHLETMATEGNSLDAQATEVAMTTAATLAIGVLQQAGQSTANAEDSPQSEALVAAAERFVRLNAGRPDLCAEAVAEAVGCSRAQLYRVFAARRRSVGELIRSYRMDQAIALLRRSPPLALKRIAGLCGYGSAGAFSRAFKDHTGLTPGQFRDTSLD